jgi:hypothetical protein
MVRASGVDIPRIDDGWALREDAEEDKQETRNDSSFCFCSFLSTSGCIRNAPRFHVVDMIMFRRSELSCVILPLRPFATFFGGRLSEVRPVNGQPFF